MSRPRSSCVRYRVWIMRYENWRPRRWNQTPPAMTADRPADDACYNADEAREMVAGFNRQELREHRGRWAVAVPVIVRHEGDLQRGAVLIANQRRSRRRQR